jgi:PBSX family phage terminase large subunit
MTRTLDILPWQNAALQNQSRYVCAHGGRGSAKSFWLMLDLYQTLCRGGQYSLFCNDYKQLRDSTHKTFESVLDLIGVQRRWLRASRIWEFPNKATVTELTFDKDKSSLKGPEWDGIYIDEGDGKATTEDKYDYLIASAARTKGKDFRVRIACNPVNHNHFIARRFALDPRPDHAFYKVATYDNTYLSPEYIADCEVRWPPGTDDHKRMMLGDIVSFAGQVYANFGPQHIVDELPEFEAYVYGQDLGVADPHVFLEGGLTRDGTLYITSEYYRPGHLDEHMPHIKSMYREGWPVVSDHSATVQRIFRQQGFQWVNANKKDKLATIHALKNRLHRNTVRVHRRCRNLINDLYSQVWRPPTPDGVEKPDHNHSHGGDALSYVCMYLDDPNRLHLQL